MNPGFQLIQLLDEAEHEPRINGFRLFESFVKNNTVRTGIGNHYKIVEYFNKMVDGFLAMLDINISAPIDYIRSALERVKLDGKYYPFLSVLYETSYSSKDLSEIISYYGIPYIQTPLANIDIVAHCFICVLTLNSRRMSVLVLHGQEICVLSRLYQTLGI